jgi:hypothetical protein
LAISAIGGAALVARSAGPRSRATLAISAVISQGAVGYLVLEALGHILSFTT